MNYILTCTINCTLTSVNFRLEQETKDGYRLSGQKLIVLLEGAGTGRKDNRRPDLRLLLRILRVVLLVLLVLLLGGQEGIMCVLLLLYLQLLPQNKRNHPLHKPPA